MQLLLLETEAACRSALQMNLHHVTLTLTLTHQGRVKVADLNVCEEERSSWLLLSPSIQLVG